MAYQPIVTLDSERVTGVEALVRWHHPARGPIPPAEFIPVAERAAMIGDIGQFVLNRACQEYAAWPGSADAYLSVNVSPLQLLDPSLRYLHRLPADIIKIDRSYVCDVSSDRSAGRLVDTLWQLFSALELTAVAEGVQERAQAEALARIGCPMAQGYLFGRPVPIGELPAPTHAEAR